MVSNYTTNSVLCALLNLHRVLNAHPIHWNFFGVQKIQYIQNFFQPEDYDPSFLNLKIIIPISMILDILNTKGFLAL
jgi:hypothetical protein